MSFRSGPRRRRLGAGLLLLFAAMLVTGPLLHHDFDCHLKSPTHCSGCGVSLAVSLAGVGVPPAIVPDATAEALPRERAMRAEHWAGLSNPGRAPPPSA